MTRGLKLMFSLVLTTSCNQSPDPVTSAVGGAVTVVTGQALIDKADKAVENRMVQGTEIASGLIDQIATQLSILTDAARQATQDTLGKSLSEMNAQERLAFQQLQNATALLESATTGAYDIEQVANIDISNTIAMIPLIPHAIYISSIRGLSVLNWENTHQIVVLATGLGPGRADQTTTVTFTIDGKAVTPTIADLSQANRGIYTFPTAALLGNNARDRITNHVMVVTLDVMRKSLLKTEKKQVKTPIFLSFYPQTAGEATVSYSVPTASYVSVGRKEQEFRTKDCGENRCGGGANETMHTDPVVNGEIPNPPLGNRKVANPSIACGDPKWDPSGCGYVRGLAAKVDSTEREVDVGWFATGSYVTMHVSYDVLEWTRGQPTPAQQAVPLMYGQVMKVCLPPNVDSGTITVKLKTGKEFQTVVGGLNVPGIMTALGRSQCASGGYEYSYHVDAPH